MKTSQKRKFTMIHDAALCIGCQACSIACRHENELPDQKYRVQVRAHISGEFPALFRHYERHSCAMCEDTPCVSVCPTGASFVNDDGVVLVREDLCVGCKYCITACPYDARYMDPITGAASKCTFCYENRTSRGELPACVSVCPTDALIFGDAADPDSAVSRAMRERQPEWYRAELKTRPKLGIYK